MPTFINAAKLARHQDYRLKANLAKAKSEHRKTVVAIAKEVDKQVSGTVKSAQLRAMGHPFGRGLSKRGYQRESLTPFGMGGNRLSTKLSIGAGAGIALLPINVQSGDLKRSLRMRAVADPRGQAFELGFTAEYAKYVLAEKGTRRMVARGFQRWKRGVDLLHTRDLERRLRLLAKSG